MSQLFSSGSQSIGASALVSALSVNIQDQFPLGWTGLVMKATIAPSQGLHSGDMAGPQDHLLPSSTGCGGELGRHAEGTGPPWYAVGSCSPEASLREGIFGGHHLDLAL